MSYKVYKYIRANSKRFVGYFRTEVELIAFFSNSKEMAHNFSIMLKDKDKFSNILEVEVFIANHGSKIAIEETK